MKAEGFSMQVVLYAKNWYKKSDDHLSDLKALMAHYSGIHVDYIGEMEVYNCVCAAFAHHACDNPAVLTNVIQELIGESWHKMAPEMMRTPLDVMLGQLAICSGEVVDPEEIFPDINFDRHKYKEQA